MPNAVAIRSKKRFFYKGMSYASIARELSLSERTVGGHLMWAYRSVRTGLDEIYHYNIG